MDFLSGFAGGNKLFQKLDKGRAGMPLGCLALHLTSLHIQRGIQRQSAIPAVFESVALQSAPVTEGTPDPNDPALEWRFSRPRKTQPHAAVEPGTSRSRRQPCFRNPDVVRYLS